MRKHVVWECDHTKCGALFRARRQAAGLSLRAVAANTGFSAPYVADLERGRRKWRIALAQKLFAALEGNSHE